MKLKSHLKISYKIKYILFKENSLNSIIIIRKTFLRDNGNYLIIGIYHRCHKIDSIKICHNYLFF